MNRNTQKVLAASMLVSSAVLTGCANTQGTSNAGLVDASVLMEKDREIVNLNERLSAMESSLSEERGRQATVPGDGKELLPPNAKPGQCYARVFVPPVYKTGKVNVMKNEASQRVETVPAKFEWVEERVMVKDASERLEVVPASYEWMTEQVLIKPAAKRIEVVPAQYKTINEKVLDKPEHTVWKKGSGPITRIDEATGEIMCLVTVPATYKTVTKRMLVSKEATREIEVPAQYETVKKQVMKTPPTTRKVVIPAEYKTVKVRKLVADASSRVIEIPAEYVDVPTRSMVKEGHVEWRPVLCDTNITPDVVRQLQTALNNAGHSPGTIDGIVGAQTLRAVQSYQKAKGLPTGGLTIKTLESLGVI